MARRSPKSYVAIAFVVIVVAAVAFAIFRPRTEHLTWKKVADENKSFRVPKATLARFGEGKNWITTAVSGEVKCTKQRFGRDPSPRADKKVCEIYS